MKSIFSQEGGPGVKPLEIPGGDWVCRDCQYRPKERGGECRAKKGDYCKCIRGEII